VKIDTFALQAAPSWVTFPLHPKAMREGGGRNAMPFSLIAALSVLGALALVWGPYLLARRWM
jgi:uncharacterized membrane protein